MLRGIWQGSEVDEDGNTEYVRQSIHSILHWVDKNDPRGPIPSNPGNDSQYDLWEAPVRGWAMIQSYNEGQEIPIGESDRNTSQNNGDEEEEN